MAALNELEQIVKSPSEESDPGEMTRRELIGHLTKTGATALAMVMGGGTVMAMLSRSAAVAAPSNNVTDEQTTTRIFHYGMVIDTKRCVGCKACVVACKAENKTPPGIFYNIVLEDALGSRPDDKPIFMARPCYHCENPPCVDVCPVDATFKRERDGIVVVDYDRCVGAKTCIPACPYNARYFDSGENYPAVAENTSYAAVPSPEYAQFRTRQESVGKVRKCTFCLHLQDEQGRYDKQAGRWPACAKTCTGHAIHFGDFNDPASEVSRLLRERKVIRLKEELGTKPNVYYII